ncbi:MAG: hypothetical protein KJ739_00990 [Nitrospinae bacterium]|nr:hypothetical protein [Nitrospinota bacterium]
MIGERSIYRKVQVVLDSAKSGKTKSLQELEENIVSLSPINFSYTIMDKKRGKRVPHCSTDSVHKIVSLCIDLELVNEKGKLTDIGINLLDQDKFEKVLSKQVLIFLKNTGITLEKMSETIKADMLQSDPVILPTSEAIWNALDQPVPLERFSVLLTLLGQCNTITTSRRKLFLP